MPRGVIQHFGDDWFYWLRFIAKNVLCAILAVVHAKRAGTVRRSDAMIADPTIQFDSAKMGHRILRRMEIREWCRFQCEFLSWFVQHPISEHLVVCGSAAMHGAFLQGRPIKDLDFLATLDDIDLLGQALEGSGFQGTCESNQITFFPAKRHVLSQQRPGYRVSLVVEVFRYNKGQQPTRLPVRFMTGQVFHLLVQPLEEMLIHKLYFTMQRAKSNDFIDLWMSLTLYPEVMPKIRQLLLNASDGFQMFRHQSYEPGKVLTNLAHCEATWEQDLPDCTITIPSYREARDMICEWLSQLAS